MSTINVIVCTRPLLFVLAGGALRHVLLPFSSGSVFRRVLPLPSEAWQEFSGDLFCHAHHAHPHAPTSSGGGGLSTATNSLALLPKEGDCLISDSSVLVRGSALSPEKVTVKMAAPVVSCVSSIVVNNTVSNAVREGPIGRLHTMLLCTARVLLICHVPSGKSI